jgi:hypothetical protein
MLPISRWNYKTDPASVTHIGPMAQDFQAIFNTGTDNKTISTIDPSGIALAGIQALQKKIESREQKIIELEKILANKNSPFIR